MKITVKAEQLKKVEKVMRFWGLVILIVAILFLLYFMNQIPRCDHTGAWESHTDSFSLFWNQSRPEYLNLTAKMDLRLDSLEWPPVIVQINKTLRASENLELRILNPGEKPCLTRELTVLSFSNGQEVKEKISIQNQELNQ